MTTELVMELRYAAGDYSLFDKSMGRDAANTIERLENELLAATIRIDNDMMEIARLTPLQYRQAPCYKFCEATAFNIEIRALKAELSKVTDELFALSQDDGKIERALDRANAEIKKLRAELAKIKLQESVAWLNDRKTIAFTRFDMDGFPENIQAMYTTPLYLAPGAPPVKAGWVMVPVTPSPEMIIAGRNTPCNTTGDIIQDYIDLYKAMLAAAQKDNS
jgi:hypothetical protein